MKNHVWKTFAAQEVSHSIAHYLTTIFDLHTTHGYARVSDVARDLDLTKGSVSVQLKHLKEKGFVTEDENRFLQLTPIGEAVAKDVRESRQILIRFLNEVLALEHARAEEDACKIEHLLGPETIASIQVLLEFIAAEEAGGRPFSERFADFRRAAVAAAELKQAEELRRAEELKKPREAEQITGTAAPAVDPEEIGGSGHGI
jgi:DtxR family Mn-dependent transcriptional regulator